MFKTIILFYEHFNNQIFFFVITLLKLEVSFFMEKVTIVSRILCHILITLFFYYENFNTVIQPNIDIIINQ